MKRNLSLTCLLFAVLLLFQCTTKLKIATVTIISKNQPNVDVIIRHVNGIHLEKFTQSATDSSGHCLIDIPMENPRFLYLQIGNKYGEFYLSPGDSLTIEHVGENYIHPLHYSGSGSIISSYITMINGMVNNFKQIKRLNNLPLEAFLYGYDSLRNKMDNFHRNFVDSVDIAPNQANLLVYKNKIILLTVAQEYQFLSLNNLYYEKWMARREGRTQSLNALDKKSASYINFEKTLLDIPFDKDLISSGYLDYLHMLNYYWQYTVRLPVEDQLADSNTCQVCPDKADSIIAKLTIPEGAREYLYVHNFDYWLTALGITPEIDLSMNRFKKKYSTSILLPTMQRKYDEWLAITPGKPAPNFNAINRDGKLISLKDFKGKFVYMDVWATWCGPCIAEIPASKKLHQEFENNNKIEFVNVSIDANPNDWSDFLQKNADWKGEHLIIQEKDQQNFSSAYKLFGVPNYILLDTVGNIINMKAPRPSDSVTSIELKKLLTN
jgi:thiol-disulfide isomerase/thioredoxin